MPKNHYIVLGISPGSTQEEIKAAFRKLAKEYHPDRYASGRAPFQVIQEAYSVLGDPERRRDYDRDLQRTRPTHRAGGPAAGSSRPRPGSVEPLAPERESGPGRTADIFDLRRSALDSLFDSLMGGFRERARLSAGQGERLEVSLGLTAAQNAAGGRVEISLPVRLRCPACSGAGGHGFSACRRCGGAGYLRAELPVLLEFPPGAGDGRRLDYPLDRQGLPGHVLTVRFSLR